MKRAVSFSVCVSLTRLFRGQILLACPCIISCNVTIDGNLQLTVLFPQREHGFFAQIPISLAHSMCHIKIKLNNVVLFPVFFFHFFPPLCVCFSGKSSLLYYELSIFGNKQVWPERPQLSLAKTEQRSQFPAYIFSVRTWKRRCGILVVWILSQKTTSNFLLDFIVKWWVVCFTIPRERGNPMPQVG